MSEFNSTESPRKLSERMREWMTGFPLEWIKEVGSLEAVILQQVKWITEYSDSVQSLEIRVAGLAEENQRLKEKPNSWVSYDEFNKVMERAEEAEDLLKACHRSNEVLLAEIKWYKDNKSGAEARIEDAKSHLSDLSEIKDRIQEGIKFVECQEVAADIDLWQSTQNDILDGVRDNDATLDKTDFVIKGDDE